MAYCSNCGAQVADAEKFCGECGYTTEKTAAPTQAAQQTAAPAPPPVQQPKVTAKKKKSKKPLVIGSVAGVVVIALVVAGIFTNGFGLFGGKSPISDLPGIKVEIPANATNEEKLAYSYMENAVSIFNEGNTHAAKGIIPAAEYKYGIAASSISAMRYAAECLLEAKGTAPAEDGRLRDWDAIAALSWTLHYPYVFEGIVLEAGGDKSAAMSCYEKAALNPLISENDAYLRYITRLNAEQLTRLRDALTKIEDEIFAVYNPVPAYIPRNENNFNGSYLREQGNAALKTDYAAAKQYFYAAVSVEPFNGNNHACLALLCMEMDDVSAAIRWLNDGLFIDPDNETLKSLHESMKGGLEQ